MYTYFANIATSDSEVQDWQLLKKWTKEEVKILSKEGMKEEDKQYSKYSKPNLSLWAHECEQELLYVGTESPTEYAISP